MKGARSYLMGLGVVVAAGVGATVLLAPTDRPAALLALGSGVVVQGPVGWWLVRSLGTPRFLAVWIAGMGTRLALVAVFAFGLVPALNLPRGSTLFALVLTLLALLLVEVVVVNLGNRRAGAS